MEIEEMQALWKTQNDANLYTINEDALYAQIKRKSQSVGQKVNLFEWIMIGTNLLVGIVLLVDVLLGTEQAYPFLFPALYLGFSLVMAVRKRVRRAEEKPFPHTMLGELDKAIWRMDYLARQGRGLVVWYFLPLVAAFGFISFFNEKLGWGLALMVVLAPVTYLASRWEVNKFYLPKKRSLEALREQLLSSPAEKEM